MGLFIKKPLADLMTEANDSGSKSLKRILGPWSLIALGVGVIIGAGLFSITGAVAAGYTGPAITLSFAIAALGCCFAGLCYAEFASMIPVAGSAYTYSYATMGELVAWIIGWDLVLEYCVAATTVSISWSRYLVVFLEGFGVHLPQALTACPWDGGIVNIPAFVIVVLMSILLIRGTEGSSIFNGIIVFLKVSVVLVFVVLGWKYIRMENYTPYIPANTGTLGEFGFSGILRNQEPETEYADRDLDVISGLYYIIYVVCPRDDRSRTLLSVCWPEWNRSCGNSYRSYGANGCFWCDSSGLPLDEPGDRNSYFTGVLLGYHGNVIRTESCILEYEPGWAAPSPIFPYP